MTHRCNQELIEETNVYTVLTGCIAWPLRTGRARGTGPVVAYYVNCAVRDALHIHASYTYIRGHLLAEATASDLRTWY